MPLKKGQKKNKPFAVRSLTTDELIKIINDSGLGVFTIEKGVGMPIHTLHKIYNKTPDNKTGYIRSLPVKWELPLLNYIKEKKALLQDRKEEIIEALEDVGLEVAHTEIKTNIPNMERKQAWINKLQEIKKEIELNN